MDDSAASPQHWGQDYWAWVGFWAQFVILGALAILGLAIAGSGAPGDDATGLLLTFAAIALAFMRLKLWFDGGATGWMAFFLPWTRPKRLGSPGSVAKSSISSFRTIPVPGATTHEPSESLTVCVEATAFPRASTIVK